MELKSLTFCLNYISKLNVKCRKSGNQENPSNVSVCVQDLITIPADVGLLTDRGITAAKGNWVLKSRW